MQRMDCHDAHGMSSLWEAALPAVGRRTVERQAAGGGGGQGSMEAELLHIFKMASLGVMAAGIAHELRVPLAIVSAAIQLLHDEPDDEQLRADAIGKIRAAVHRAALTIENLLRFARPSVEKEPIDVPALIGETLDLLAPQLRQCGIVATRPYPPGVPAVLGNRNLLQQVVTNLVLNACQAMPHGGTLTFAATRSPGGEIEIRCTDTGHGILRQHLSRIFDPFFSTRPTGQGTGLGLALSRAIIEQHRGSIGVHSELGKGATFIIRLPAAGHAAQTAAGSAVTAPAARPAGAGLAG